MSTSDHHPDSVQQSEVPAWLLPSAALILAFLFFASSSMAGYYLFLWRPDVSAIVESSIEGGVESIEDNDEASKEVIAVGVEIAAETAPVVTTEVAKRLMAEREELWALTKSESSKLIAAMEDRLGEELDEQLELLLDQHQEVLEDEFPELASDEELARLTERYRETAKELMTRYYLDEFRTQALRTVDLWYAFKPIDPSQLDAPLHEKLTEYGLDWILLKTKDQAGTRLSMGR
ncbi:hypothetical protein Pan216_32350 [Planctomycetes bacterium Pan216]|uniref:Uncharacterized protein n=1 Tax=Kolteria novifilia TaxID=2527975 RepID=A0A518B5W7_9BACT|nr:hypothetical protein Pan216_32350 [Planctomycetes bacterium Pan216]